MGIAVEVVALLPFKVFGRNVEKWFWVKLFKFGHANIRTKKYFARCNLGYRLKASLLGYYSGQSMLKASNAYSKLLAL